MTLSSPITLHSDTLSVGILPQGAALVAVRFANHTRNMVIGFADPQDHINVQICAGSLVGPVANRVRGGAVTLAGKTYQMPLNEGPNTLHSGPEGLHTQVWRVDSQTSTALTLSCHLSDAVNGLPGNRQITATYSLAGNTLTLSITATTDQPTPMNIAAHPYWNLDGHTDISGHRISVHANEYLPTDAQGLPTGILKPVDGTAFDFKTASLVPLIAELDVNFCLANSPRPHPEPAAVLIGSDGTRLDIATTAPGLQIYAGSGLPDLPVAMAGSPPLKPYSGIALEPQHWPDAPHNAHFPHITLLPGQIYTQTTHYTLTPP
ncbi:MAG: aldose epimerase family protein [Sulfitobacter sp.]